MQHIYIYKEWWFNLLPEAHVQAVVTKLTSADGAFIPAPAASRSHDRSSSEHLLHLLCISLLAHLLRTSRSRSCPSHPLRYGEVYGQGEGCSATIRESLTFASVAPRLLHALRVTLLPFRFTLSLFSLRSGLPPFFPSLGFTSFPSLCCPTCLLPACPLV